MHKCSDATRGENDPECADMNEINEWLKTKALQIRVVDNKIDFDSYEDYAIR